MISRIHISAQKPRGRMLNTKVCGSESAIFLIERLHVTSQPCPSAILVHNQILPFTDEMVNCAVVRCS